jgi:hypothetical protein
LSVRSLFTGHRSLKKKANLVRLFRNVAEWTGLEPATPGVTGRYSNQLNYHSSCNAEYPVRSEPLIPLPGLDPAFITMTFRIASLVGAERFELPTFAL